MLNTMQSAFITIPLTSEAYKQARRFASYHQNPNKARQVYLNILALYAMVFYCQLQDIKTNPEGSNSFDILRQMVHNIADLNLPDYGTVFCCPVIPNQTETIIYPETDQPHIGYIVVEIDETARTAKLKGFIPSKPDFQEIDLIKDQQAFDTFLDYLKPQPRFIPLAQFYHLFQTNNLDFIQSIKDYGYNLFSEAKNFGEILTTQLKQPEPVILSRSTTQEQVNDVNLVKNSQSDFSDIFRQIDLDNLDYSLGLRLRYKQDQENQFKFSIRLFAFLENQTIPQGLKISLLEDHQELFNQISQGQKELKLSDNLLTASEGDSFAIKVELDDAEATYYFTF